MDNSTSLRRITFPEVHTTRTSNQFIKTAGLELNIQDDEIRIHPVTVDNKAIQTIHLTIPNSNFAIQELITILEGI